MPSFAEDLEQVRAPAPDKPLEAGNIDLYAQPKVGNADGSVSTVDSRSYNIDGKEVLLPTVTPDGRHFVGPNADNLTIAEYRKTGRHLGKFETPAAADAYAQQLHEDYAAGKYDKRPPQDIELPAEAFAKDLAAVRGGKPLAADSFEADLAAVRVPSPHEMPHTAQYADERAQALAAQAPPAPRVEPPTTTLTIEGKPVGTGRFSPLEQDVIGRSPAAQSVMKPAYAPSTPPNPESLQPGYTPPGPQPTMLTPNPVPGAREAPMGTIPILDWAAAGPPQMMRGARALLEEQAKPPGTIMRGRFTGLPGAPAGPLSEKAKAAYSDILEGGFATLTPVFAGALLAAPVAGLIGLGEVVAAQKAAEGAVSAAGGSEQDVRLVGNLAALAATGHVADSFVDAAKRAARPLILAGQISGSGYGPGDIPGHTMQRFGELQGVADRPTATEPAHRPTVSPLIDLPDQALHETVETGINPANKETAADELARRAERELPPTPVHEQPPVPPVDIPAEAATETAPRQPRTPWAPAVPPEMHGRSFEEDLATARTPEGEPVDESAPGTVHKFSSTQVDLPPETANTMREMAAAIPKADVAEDGRESDFHVTVKYGLHTADAEKVRAILADEPPITATLGKTSVFPNSESNSGDVVKVDVTSPDLQRLNQKIADALPHTDTHPDYQPHATVAYVKPGLGEKYAGDGRLDGQTVTIDHLTFTGKNGESVDIPLTGTRPATLPGAPNDEAAAVPQVPASGAVSTDRGEESAGADRGGLQPEGSRPPVGRKRQPRPRRPAAQSQAAEQAALADAVAKAQAGGYAGDPAALHTELAQRLQAIRELDAEFADSGRNPEALLRAIAQGGGLGKDPTYPGELKWLKELRDQQPSKSRTNLKAPPVTAQTVRGIAGVFRQDGLTLGGMVEHLSQDPRFAHIRGVNDFLDELRHAATSAPEKDAVTRLIKGLGEKWWERVGTHTPSAEDEDVSFDPEQLEAEPRGDVNEHGEAQPRLRGAEEARQVGKASTSFKAPVQATSEDFGLTPEGAKHKEEPTSGGLFDDFTQDLADLEEDEKPEFSARRPLTGAWERPPQLPASLRAADGTPRKETARELLNRVTREMREPQQGTLFPLSEDEPTFSKYSKAARNELLRRWRKNPKGFVATLRRQAQQQQRDLNAAYDSVPMWAIGERSVPVYDEGKRLTHDEIAQIFGSEDAEHLATTMLDLAENIGRQLFPDGTVNGHPIRTERIGLYLTAKAFGVFFINRGRTTIYINLFEQLRSGGRVDAEGMLIGTARTPYDAAENVFKTIVHEWTHEQVRGHEDDFKLQYALNIARLGSPFRDRAMHALEEAYADPATPGQLRPALARALSIYTASRGRRATAPEPLERARGDYARLADDAEGQAGPDGGLRQDRADTLARRRAAGAARRLFTRDIRPTTREDLIDAVAHAPGLLAFPEYQHLLNRFGLRQDGTEAPRSSAPYIGVEGLMGSAAPQTARTPADLAAVAALGARPPRMMTIKEMRASKGELLQGGSGSRQRARRTPSFSEVPRVVTYEQLARLANKLGTTVDVQAGRARAAGYTIADNAPEVHAANIAEPVAQAHVVPGLGPFVTRDVTPTAEKAFQEVAEASTSIRALFAPASVSPAAETMMAVTRPNLALRRQRTARAQKAMRALEIAFDKIPQAGQLAFAYAVDEGRLDDLPEAQREAARVFQQINSAKRREANSLGGKVGFIKDYYPREWVQPGKVREFIMRTLYGKRPLQGRAGFKKARTRDKETGEIIPFRSYIAHGFEPVSYNPVTAHLRKWLEMDKWIAARRILLDGRAAGVAKFVKVGEQPPAGWMRYPESFGTVYGPPSVPIKEAYDAGLMEAIHRFAEEHGITMVRKINLGGKGRWGYVISGVKKVHSKFGGAEGILMHEIGHVLDEHYGVGQAIGLAQYSERREEINFNETPTKVLKELRALADLRLNPTDSPSHKSYVRSRPEVMANLVHAFLYAPDLAKTVAPNAYWALYNLAKDREDLRGLLDIQKARSLRFAVNEAEARVEGRLIKGYYYGSVDAVRLLENHLSPGLRGNQAFDLYRRAGNLLNQVQLGLSAFHVVGTALNSTISRFALGLEQLSRGQVLPGLKSVAVSLTVVGSPIRDVVMGHRSLKAYYAKDATFRTLVDEADIIAKAGGGVGWDTFWHDSAPERFMQALRGVKAEAEAGNYLGAGARTAVLPLRAMLAFVELQARPVMQEWVPRLKLAAFMDLARMELADLGEKPDPIEAAKVLAKAWDSIDNRFGQLIYDNVFWHAILKDASMASVRAMGWDLGTVREVFGAIPAQLNQLGLGPTAAGGSGLGKPPTRLRNTRMEPDPEGGPPIPIYERGRAPLLTHKFAYFSALLFMSALFGALYQYLHTGKRPGEQEDGSVDPATLLLDLYFPRTGARRKDGKEERASLPTYMKDVYGGVRHPVDTALGKIHPMLALLKETIGNEDHFGNAFRDPDDPVLRQILDTFSHAASMYQPISVKSFLDREKTGAKKNSGVTAAESLLGINAAPARVSSTPMEEYLHGIAPPAHNTKLEAEHAAARRAMRDDLRAGDREAAKKEADEGGLGPRSRLATARAARLDAVQLSFRHVTLDQALHAYELGTPEERRDVRPFLARKVRSLLPQEPPADIPRFRDAYRHALTLPVAPAAHP
jgi:2'-5' RNA ligase